MAFYLAIVQYDIGFEAEGLKHFLQLKTKATNWFGDRRWKLKPVVYGASYSSNNEVNYIETRNSQQLLSFLLYRRWHVSWLFYQSWRSYPRLVRTLVLILTMSSESRQPRILEQGTWWRWSWTLLVSQWPCLQTELRRQRTDIFVSITLKLVL